MTTADHTCADMRTLLGVSVLGLTEPDEERAVQEHLTSCGECAAEYAELAPVVPLLATVSPADAMVDLPEPRPELLRRIIAETRQPEPTATVTSLDAKRRRRWVVRSGVAVGLAAAAATIVVVAPWQHDAPSAPPTAAPVITASGSNQRSGVTADFTITPVDTGSEIAMTLSGVKPGDHCWLVAYGPQGRHEVAATWVVSYGGDATITGHTSLSADGITRMSIVEKGGRTLLRVPGSAFVTS